MRIVTMMVTVVLNAMWTPGAAMAQTAALPERYVKPVQAEQLREMKLEMELQREQMRFANIVDQARRELNLPEGARFDMQNMRFVAPPPQQQMPQVNVQQNVQQNNVPAAKPEAASPEKK